MTSCEKEDIRKSSPVNPTTVDENDVDNDNDTTSVDDNDSTNVEAKNHALFVNALEGVVGEVSINLDGITLLDDLGLREVSEYLPISLEGEALTGTLEVLDGTGSVIAAKDLNLLDFDVANIILVDGENGPTIELLDLNLTDFEGGSGGLDLLEGLDLPLGTELFDLNFLNLTDITDVESLLAGVDLLNADGDLVGGLLELPQGVLSGVLSGNDDILSDLGILGSDLALEDLLTELLSQDGLLNVLELGDVVGLGNISNGGLLQGVFDLLEDLLGNILGGGSSNPLELLEGGLLEGLNLEPGNDYTAILFGEEGALSIIPINQTELGLFDLLQP